MELTWNRRSNVDVWKNQMTMHPQLLLILFKAMSQFHSDQNNHLKHMCHLLLDFQNLKRRLFPSCHHQLR